MRLASVLQVSVAPELQMAPGRRGSWWPATAIAAVAMAVLVVVLVFRTPRPTGPSWEVSGLPGTSHLQAGDVLQTGMTADAQVKIANIGQLVLSPNTQIRLLVTKSDEHRIALDRGRVEAQTWAPPRLFVVDTPSATAVDLGCKYSLEVQDNGDSLLHVTLGLVALDRDGRETVVPAGAFCRTRRGGGPGTPFFEDSSAEFRAALRRVDSLQEGPERAQQLQTVIREAHVRDSLSLWHLLPRLSGEERGLIYDRLTALLPAPQNVTREGIVALDSKMLDSWKNIVSQLWQ